MVVIQTSVGLLEYVLRPAVKTLVPENNGHPLHHGGGGRYTFQLIINLEDGFCSPYRITLDLGWGFSPFPNHFELPSMGVVRHDTVGVD